ncbi:hypothetical protein [Bacteroides clarus]|jgi:hypothetical protein|uniref:hypothetical protein n=1 Tax=Bacteroides clarus TaxID=626929 RepID=UPI00242E7D58|nr:hypothetical protein [Bacteroides clarus]
MKQTVEEAAKEARMASAETLTTYGTHTSLDDFTYLSHDEIAEAAFIKGAEWQAKQSPWISVEERLPEIVTKDGESDYMLVRYNDCIPVVAKYCTDEYHVCPMFKVGNKTYRSHWITPTYEWIKHNAIHYMPIPSFDEILEVNKDVLERIKEKGD